MSVQPRHLSVNVKDLHTCSNCYERPVFFSEEDLRIHDKKYHSSSSVTAPKEMMEFRHGQTLNSWTEDLRQWGETRMAMFVLEMSSIKEELKRNGNHLNLLFQQMNCMADIVHTNVVSEEEALVVGERKKNVRRKDAFEFRKRKGSSSSESSIVERESNGEYGKSQLDVRYLNQKINTMEKQLTKCQAYATQNSQRYNKLKMYTAEKYKKVDCIETTIKQVKQLVDGINESKTTVETKDDTFESDVEEVRGVNQARKRNYFSVNNSSNVDLSQDKIPNGYGIIVAPEKKSSKQEKAADDGKEKSRSTSTETDLKGLKNHSYGYIPTKETLRLETDNLKIKLKEKNEKIGNLKSSLVAKENELKKIHLELEENIFLQNSRESLKVREGTMEKEIGDLTGKLRLLQKQILLENEEKIQLHQEVKTLKEEYRNTESINNNLRKEIDTFHKKDESRNAKLNNLMKSKDFQIKSSEEQINDLLTKSEEQKLLIETFVQDKETLKAETYTIQDNYNMAQKELVELTTLYDSVNTKLTEMKCKNDELILSLKLSSEEIKKISDLRIESEREAERMRSIIDTNDNNLEVMKNDLALKTKDFNGVNIKLEQTKKINSSWTRKFKAVTRKLKETEKDVITKQETFLRLEERFKEVNAENESKETKLTHLTKDLTKAMNKKTEEENERLKLTNLLEENKILTSNLLNLKEQEINDVQNECDALQTELTGVKELHTKNENVAIVHMEGTIRKLNDVITSKDKQFNVLMAEKDVIVKNTSTVDKMLNQKDELLNKAINEKDAITKNVKMHCEEVAILKDQLHNRIEEQKETERELEVSEQNVTSLSKELSEVTKLLDGAKKEISSVDKWNFEVKGCMEELERTKNECNSWKENNLLLTKRLKEMGDEMQLLKTVDSTEKKRKNMEESESVEKKSNDNVIDEEREKELDNQKEL